MKIFITLGLLIAFLPSFPSLSLVKTAGWRTKLYFKLYCQQLHSSQETVTEHVQYCKASKDKTFFIPQAAVMTLSYCRAGQINTPTGQKNELHNYLEVQWEAREPMWGKQNAGN